MSTTDDKSFLTAPNIINSKKIRRMPILKEITEQPSCFLPKMEQKLYFPTDGRKQKRHICPKKIKTNKLGGVVDNSDFNMENSNILPLLNESYERLKKIDKIINDMDSEKQYTETVENSIPLHHHIEEDVTRSLIVSEKDLDEIMQNDRDLDEQIPWLDDTTVFLFHVQDKTEQIPMKQKRLLYSGDKSTPESIYLSRKRNMEITTITNNFISLKPPSLHPDEIEEIGLTESIPLLRDSEYDNVDNADYVDIYLPYEEERQQDFRKLTKREERSTAARKGFNLPKYAEGISKSSTSRDQLNPFLETKYDKNYNYKRNVPTTTVFWKGFNWPKFDDSIDSVIRDSNKLLRRDRFKSKKPSMKEDFRWPTTFNASPFIKNNKVQNKEFQKMSEKDHQSKTELVKESVTPHPKFLKSTESDVSGIDEINGLTDFENTLTTNTEGLNLITSPDWKNFEFSQHLSSEKNQIGLKTQIATTAEVNFSKHSMNLLSFTWPFHVEHKNAGNRSKVSIESKGKKTNYGDISGRRPTTKMYERGDETFRSSPHKTVNNYFSADVVTDKVSETKEQKTKIWKNFHWPIHLPFQRKNNSRIANQRGKSKTTTESHRIDELNMEEKEQTTEIIQGMLSSDEMISEKSKHAETVSITELSFEKENQLFFDTSKVSTSPSITFEKNKKTYLVNSERKNNYTSGSERKHFQSTFDWPGNQIFGGEKANIPKQDESETKNVHNKSVLPWKSFNFPGQKKFGYTKSKTSLHETSTSESTFINELFNTFADIEKSTFKIEKELELPEHDLYNLYKNFDTIEQEEATELETGTRTSKQWRLGADKDQFPLDSRGNKTVHHIATEYPTKLTLLPTKLTTKGEKIELVEDIINFKEHPEKNETLVMKGPIKTSSDSKVNSKVIESEDDSGLWNFRILEQGEIIKHHKKTRKPFFETTTIYSFKPVGTVGDDWEKFNESPSERTIADYDREISDQNESLEENLYMNDINNLKRNQEILDRKSHRISEEFITQGETNYASVEETLKPEMKNTENYFKELEEFNNNLKEISSVGIFDQNSSNDYLERPTSVPNEDIIGGKHVIESPELTFTKDYGNGGSYSYKKIFLSDTFSKSTSTSFVPTNYTDEAETNTHFSPNEEFSSTDIISTNKQELPTSTGSENEAHHIRNTTTSYLKNTYSSSSHDGQAISKNYELNENMFHLSEQPDNLSTLCEICDETKSHEEHHLTTKQILNRIAIKTTKTILNDLREKEHYTDENQINHQEELDLNLHNFSEVKYSYFTRAITSTASVKDFHSEVIHLPDEKYEISTISQIYNGEENVPYSTTKFIVSTNTPNKLTTEYLEKLENVSQDDLLHLPQKEHQETSTFCELCSEVENGLTLPESHQELTTYDEGIQIKEEYDNNMHHLPENLRQESTTICVICEEQTSFPLDETPSTSKIENQEMEEQIMKTPEVKFETNNQVPVNYSLEGREINRPVPTKNVNVISFKQQPTTLSTVKSLHTGDNIFFSQNYSPTRKVQEVTEEQIHKVSYEITENSSQDLNRSLPPLSNFSEENLRPTIEGKTEMQVQDETEGKVHDVSEQKGSKSETVSPENSLNYKDEHKSFPTEYYSIGETKSQTGNRSSEGRASLFSQNVSTISMNANCFPIGSSTDFKEIFDTTTFPTSEITLSKGEFASRSTPLETIGVVSQSEELHPTYVGENSINTIFSFPGASEKITEMNVYNMKETFNKTDTEMNENEIKHSSKPITLYISEFASTEIGNREIELSESISTTKKLHNENVEYDINMLHLPQADVHETSTLCQICSETEENQAPVGTFSSFITAHVLERSTQLPVKELTHDENEFADITENIENEQEYESDVLHFPENKQIETSTMCEICDHETKYDTEKHISTSNTYSHENQGMYGTANVKLDINETPVKKLTHDENKFTIMMSTKYIENEQDYESRMLHLPENKRKETTTLCENCNNETKYGIVEYITTSNTDSHENRGMSETTYVKLDINETPAKKITHDENKFTSIMSTKYIENEQDYESKMQHFPENKRIETTTLCENCNNQTKYGIVEYITTSNTDSHENREMSETTEVKLNINETPVKILTHYESKFADIMSTKYIENEKDYESNILHFTENKRIETSTICEICDKETKYGIVENSSTSNTNSQENLGMSRTTTVKLDINEPPPKKLTHDENTFSGMSTKYIENGQDYESKILHSSENKRIETTTMCENCDNETKYGIEEYISTTKTDSHENRGMFETTKLKLDINEASVKKLTHDENKFEQDYESDMLLFPKNKQIETSTMCEICDNETKYGFEEYMSTSNTDSHENLGMPETRTVKHDVNETITASHSFRGIEINRPLPTKNINILPFKIFSTTNLGLSDVNTVNEVELSVTKLITSTEKSTAFMETFSNEHSTRESINEKSYETEFNRQSEKPINSNAAPGNKYTDTISNSPSFGAMITEKNLYANQKLLESTDHEFQGNYVIPTTLNLTEYLGISVFSPLKKLTTEMVEGILESESTSVDEMLQNKNNDELEIDMLHLPQVDQHETSTICQICSEVEPVEESLRPLQLFTTQNPPQRTTQLSTETITEHLVENKFNGMISAEHTVNEEDYESNMLNLPENEREKTSTVCVICDERTKYEHEEHISKLKTDFHGNIEISKHTDTTPKIEETSTETYNFGVIEVKNPPPTHNPNIVSFKMHPTTNSELHNVYTGSGEDMFRQTLNQLTLINNVHVEPFTIEGITIESFNKESLETETISKSEEPIISFTYELFNSTLMPSDLIEMITESNVYTTIQSPNELNDDFNENFIITNKLNETEFFETSVASFFRKLSTETENNIERDYSESISVEGLIQKENMHEHKTSTISENNSEVDQLLKPLQLFTTEIVESETTIQSTTKIIPEHFDKLKYSVKVHENVETDVEYDSNMLHLPENERKDTSTICVICDSKTEYKPLESISISRPDIHENPEISTSTIFDETETSRTIAGTYNFRGLKIDRPVPTKNMNIIQFKMQPTPYSEFNNITTTSKLELSIEKILTAIKQNILHIEPHSIDSQTVSGNESEIHLATEQTNAVLGTISSENISEYTDEYIPFSTVLKVQNQFTETEFFLENSNPEMKKESTSLYLVHDAENLSGITNFPISEYSSLITEFTSKPESLKEEETIEIGKSVSSESETSVQIPMAPSESASTTSSLLEFDETNIDEYTTLSYVTSEIPKHDEHLQNNYENLSEITEYPLSKHSSSITELASETGSSKEGDGMIATEKSVSNESSSHFPMAPDESVDITSSLPEYSGKNLDEKTILSYVTSEITKHDEHVINKSENLPEITEHQISEHSSELYSETGSLEEEEESVETEESVSSESEASVEFPKALKTIHSYITSEITQHGEHEMINSENLSEITEHPISEHSSLINDLYSETESLEQEEELEGPEESVISKSETSVAFSMAPNETASTTAPLLAYNEKNLEGKTIYSHVTSEIMKHEHVINNSENLAEITEHSIFEQSSSNSEFSGETESLDEEVEILETEQAVNSETSLHFLMSLDESAITTSSLHMHDEEHSDEMTILQYITPEMTIIDEHGSSSENIIDFHETEEVSKSTFPSTEDSIINNLLDHDFENEMTDSSKVDSELNIQATENEPGSYIVEGNVVESSIQIEEETTKLVNISDQSIKSLISNELNQELGKLDEVVNAMLTSAPPPIEIITVEEIFQKMDTEKDILENELRNLQNDFGKMLETTLSSDMIQERLEELSGTSSRQNLNTQTETNISSSVYITTETTKLFTEIGLSTLTPETIVEKSSIYPEKTTHSHFLESEQSETSEISVEKELTDFVEVESTEIMNSIIEEAENESITKSIDKVLEKSETMPDISNVSSIEELETTGVGEMEEISQEDEYISPIGTTIMELDESEVSPTSSSIFLGLYNTSAISSEQEELQTSNFSKSSNEEPFLVTLVESTTVKISTENTVKENEWNGKDNYSKGSTVERVSGIPLFTTLLLSLVASTTQHSEAPVEISGQYKINENQTLPKCLVVFLTGENSNQSMISFNGTKWVPSQNAPFVEEETTISINTNMFEISQNLEHTNVEKTAVTTEVSTESETSEVTESPSVQSTEEIIDTSNFVEGGCTEADFENNNNCFCMLDLTVDHIAGDFQVSNSSKSNQVKCSSFLKVNTGLIIKDENSSPKRDKRSYLYLRYHNRKKREIVDYNKLDEVLANELVAPNTGIIIYTAVGSSVYIPCVYKNEIVEREHFTKYIWTSEEDKLVPLSDRVQETTDGVLKISDVTIKDGGNYTCSVTRPFGNADSERKYFNHELIIVERPIFKIKTTIMYNTQETCSLKQGDTIHNYLPKLLEELLCGLHKRVCRVEMERPSCIQMEDKTYLTFKYSVAIDPLPSLIPSLSYDKCDFDCQMKIYGSLVSLLIKNVETISFLNIISESKSSNHTLKPKEVKFPTDRKTAEDTTLLPKLMIGCPPGFGIQQTTNKLCVACPRDFYSADNSSSCVPCPFIHFQPNLGSTSCKECKTPFEDKSCMGMVLANKSFLIIYIGSSVAIIFLILLCVFCAQSVGTPANKKKKAQTPKRRRIGRRDIEDPAEKTLLLKDIGTRKVIKGPKVPPPDF